MSGRKEKLNKTITSETRPDCDTKFILSSFPKEESEIQPVKNVNPYFSSPPIPIPGRERIEEIERKQLANEFICGSPPSRMSRRRI